MIHSLISSFHIRHHHNITNKSILDQVSFNSCARAFGN